MKKNSYKTMFDKMLHEENDAKVEYNRIMFEDKNKTYMDILPQEFKNFKRSVIKREILSIIESVTNFLNTCPLYEGRGFDKKEIVRYMMRGTDYTNFYLADMFIPRKSDMDVYIPFWNSIRDKNLTETERSEQLTKYREDHIAEFEVYYDLQHHLQCLKQSWEAYVDHQKVKNGELVHDYDIEKDGYPRASRGNLCYLFIPVKGKLPKEDKEKLILYNPRTKKSQTFIELKYKKEDDIYSCLDSNGKKIFLSDYNSIDDAWDCLFTINKEIYSGWWNKVMILK